MSPDEQEARSRRYANERIVLLPLSSGAIAVFNSGGDLCAIEPEAWFKLEDGYFGIEMTYVKWYPPAASAAKPNPTLEELFS